MRATDVITHSAPMIGEEEIEAVSAVLRSGRIAQGVEVAAFEEECADAVGRRYGVAVSSGTAAMHLALNALGVDCDTRVAVPAYACASLLTAVTLQGTRAHLCDVGDDFNLDAESVPADCGITILPHLFGKRAAMPGQGRVIEDIAQSIGGTTGSIGKIAIASFYATKLMTTGEGGMVLTDDEAIAEHARDRRDYDNRDDFLPRFAYKMTDFQAALGRVQLRRLSGFITRRGEIAAQYLEGFEGLPLGLPDSKDHVFFRFVVSTDERARLEEHLGDCGIEAKRPVYRAAHRYFEQSGEAYGVRVVGSYAGADRAHACCLSLPIHPGMLDDDVQHVVRSVCGLY